MPPARRRAIRKRANELIKEELTLRDLRRVLSLTQVQLAASMGKRQDEISRIEQRGDLLLSTLQEYVRSLGGELELVCKFADRDPIRIKSIPGNADGR
jgi:predicted transcriptional regulator